jgi:hypothetical protein
MKKVPSLPRFRVDWTFCETSPTRVAGIWGILTLFLCATEISLRGQALPSATSVHWNPGAFVTATAVNTQFPFYADNGLGFNFGAFVQSSHRVGAEARGSVYPISVRFSQAPFTAGVRIVGRRPSNVRLQPFGYIGGGVSRAQDSGPTYQPMAVSWSPCWQASAGLDFSFGRFSLRAAELSWTQTYGPRNDLRSLSASTGLVYRFSFGHSGERTANEKVALAIAQTSLSNDDGHKIRTSLFGRKPAMTYAPPTSP